MSSRCKRSLRGVSFAVVVLGAVLTHRAEALPTTKVCIDQSNPAASIDARVASAALKSQGYAMQQVFFVGHGKQADDGFPVRRFAKLAQSECALIMGFPVDVGAPHLPPDTRATAAYASTGFVIVQHTADSARSLDDLPAGSEVGIAQLDTWAGLLFSAHPNVVMHVYADDAQMLADLQRHRIAAGLTWQSYLQAYEKRHVRGARLSARVLPGAHMLWNLVALYAPASQDAADRFGKGLEALRDSGALARLIKPFQAAVAETGNVAAFSDSAARRRIPPARCASAAKPAKSKARLPKAPALYTEAQAAQGAIFYFQNCGMCHGPLMDGQRGGYPGPALKGADFADPSYDFHVDEIFHFVAKLMPAQKPGSLTDVQNVDIMAYLLKQNGYPAGASELTFDGAMHSRAPIRYYGD